MYEITSFIKNTAEKIEWGLHIIETPAGFVFRGTVPVDLLYVNATPDQLALVKAGLPYKKENAHRFPTLRIFATREDAEAAAESIA
jgi:hypothetical protein